MKPILTESVRLKAEAYQYQVKRFGNYRPQKPLNKAISRTPEKTLTVAAGQE